MRLHFFLLFYHPDYQFLPSNHQAKFLQEHYEITVSDQSLRNWQKLLIEKNWIAKDKEKVKYILCRKDHAPKDMTEERYKQAWNEFYSRVADGEESGEARKAIYHKYGGMPRKQVGIAENALEREKLEELYRILSESV